MQLSEKDMAFLVEKIKNEVNKVVIEQKGVAKDKVFGTVVLIPAFVPSPSKAFEFIQQKLGEDAELVTFNGLELNLPNFNVKKISTNEEKSKLMERLVMAKTIVLLTPSVGMLKSIGQGNDEGFVEGAILRSILWGREVKVVLDFEPPKFRRGSFFENIVLSIDALTSMGIKVLMYKIAGESAEKKVSLITEVEVIDAYNAGRKTISSENDAIITPLARDKANELKINIE